MEKDRAIEILKRQSVEAENLQKVSRGSPQFEKWRRDTKVAIGKVFGKENDYNKSFEEIKYSSMYEPVNNRESSSQRTYVQGLVKAKAIIDSMIDEVKDYWNEKVESNSKTEYEIIEQLFNRFHKLARQLENRHQKRNTLKIDDEYDVQDLLHAILVLYYDDIRSEEWVPSYAGGSSRMDFLLKDEQTVIEVKKTRPGLGSRELGEQLIIDCEKYKSHPSCRTLLCFVYDPDSIIVNPRGIESDLNRHQEDFVVRVYVRPLGL